MTTQPPRLRPVKSHATTESLMSAALNLAKLLQEVQEARQSLKAEQDKVFRLEVQLAEANEKLEQLPDLERQVNNYR